MTGLSKGLKMATSSSPELQVQINLPLGRFFTSGDLVAGVVTMNTPFDCLHEGVRVILRGQVINKEGAYFTSG